MKSIRKGFIAPTLEFFPYDGEGIKILRVEPGESGMSLIFSAGKILDSITMSIPTDAITSYSVNDIGGLNLTFNTSFRYIGGGASFMTLEGPESDSNKHRQYNFSYGEIARVWDKDEVVWENRDVPMDKRKLCLETRV